MFLNRCSTEEACDELILASSADYKQDRYVFSGNRERWHDIEIPGTCGLFKRTLLVMRLLEIMNFFQVSIEVSKNTGHGNTFYVR